MSHVTHKPAATAMIVIAAYRLTSKDPGSRIAGHLGKRGAGRQVACDERLGVWGARRRRRPEAPHVKPGALDREAGISTIGHSLSDLAP